MTTSRHDQNYEFWPNFPKVRTIVNLGNKYWSPLIEDIRMNLIPLRYPEWIASIEGYSIDPQKLPISDIKISVQNKEIIDNYFPENWSENYWIKYGGYTATCRRIESHQRWTTISGNKKKNLGLSLELYFWLFFDLKWHSENVGKISKKS